MQKPRQTLALCRGMVGRVTALRAHGLLWSLRAFQIGGYELFCERVDLVVVNSHAAFTQS
ncbi:hypothetical protein JNO12_10810 [Erwinia aphidicola]|nr:hypothetical protein [Erwinia aphidicola]